MCCYLDWLQKSSTAPRETLPALAQSLTFPSCRRLFERRMPAKTNTCHPLIFGSPSFRLQDGFWKEERILFTVVSDLLGAVEGSQLFILMSQLSPQLPVPLEVFSEWSWFSLPWSPGRYHKIDVVLLESNIYTKKWCIVSCITELLSFSACTQVLFLCTSFITVALG